MSRNSQQSNAERIAELTRTLRETEAELRRLTGGREEVGADRERMEAALAESERRYRDLVETSHDLIWSYDSEGVIRFMNQACRSIFGREPEEMVGRHFKEFIPPDQLESDMAAFTEAMELGLEKTGYLSRCRHKDGSIITLSVNTRILRDASGRVIGGTCNGRDVTASARAEEALRASESRFRAIIESEPECVKIVSKDGLLLDMNPAGLRMVEAPDEESVLGREVVKMVHEDDRERFLELHRQVMLGRSGEAQFRIIGLGGRERWVDSHSTPLLAADGSVSSALSVTRDITEMRRAAEERDRLYNLSMDLLCVLSFDGMLEQINPAWTTCLGWTGEELTSRPHIDFVHPDDRPKTLAAAEALRRGEPLRDFSNRHLCKDGSIRWLSWNAHPALESRQVVAVARDITQQRKDEEQLRLLETCVAHLHDIVVITEAEPLDEPGPRILYVNEAFVRRTGYTREEAVGKTPRLLQGPRTQRDALDRIRKALKAWKPAREELINYTKAGEEFWLEIQIVPVADSTGWYTHWIAIERDVTQRHEAEERLRESEERHRLMIEGSERVLFYTHDREHRFKYLSPSTREVLGYEPEELEGKLCAEILLQDDPQNAVIDELTETAMRDGKPCEPYVAAAVHKTGRHIQLEVLATPIFRAGQVVGLQGFARDVTDRKKMERALRASEALFRSLIQNSWDVYHLVGLDGTIIYESPAVTRVLGYLPEEVVGRNALEFLHPDDLAAAMDPGSSLPTPGGTRSMQMRVRNKAGEWRWIESFEVNLLDDPDVRAIAVNYRDITERKQAEEALRESEARFRSMANSMSQLAWIARPDGHITWYNQRWYDYTGTTLDQMEGWGWRDAHDPAALAEVMERWRGSLATAEPFEMEFPLRGADGQFRIFLTRAVPIKDSRGALVQWFGTNTDVHELKRAESEMLRSNRALKMLSASNEALIRADQESVLLSAVCDIAAGIGGYGLAWVGFANEDEAKTIEIRAQSGVGGEGIRDIQLSWDAGHPGGQGPAGEVVRSGKLAQVSNLGEANLRGPWVDFARTLGFQSVVFLPLNGERRTFGLLALSRTEKSEAAPEELQLLQQLADDLAFGIVTLRAEKERQRLQEAVIAISRGVSTSVGAEFFEDLTRHMVEALKADGGFIAKLDPSNPGRAKSLATFVDGAPGGAFDYALEGTPCQEALRGELCVIDRSARQLFPDDPLLEELGVEAYAGTPLVNTDGKCLGVMAVFFRKPSGANPIVRSTLQIFASRAAAELERQKVYAQLREHASLLDKATDAIFVRDLESRILFWSQSAERVYGWSSSEALGRSSHELMQPDREAFDAATRRLLDRGEWVGELQKVTKSGQLLSVDCRWTRVMDERGEPASILCIESDITAKKRMESQFLRAQRMESIGTLAGGIAHDLNNVLAPILMSIELLQMTATDRESEELLATLHRSAQHGADLVKQVLAFARGVEGKRINVSVAHLWRDVRRIVEDTFPKDVVFQWEAPKEVWNVMGDPTQLSQVFTNLCVNARDAMPKGGVLAVRLENVRLDDTYCAMNPDATPGDYLLVAVSDTGEGIPAGIQSKIFEPFFTTKAAGKGTGLGLSTSLAIVRSHGGFIHLQSSVGKGSTFKVHLPATASFAAPAGVSDRKAELPHGHGELILVVDDEDAIRMIAQSTLQRFGYSVLLAGNGAEAVSIYAMEQARIALVLTDMVMPIMDGQALILALRSINPKVKVIASSGNASNGGVAKAIASGAKHFVPKPYTAETLLATLREALGGD